MQKNFSRKITRQFKCFQRSTRSDAELMKKIEKKSSGSVSFSLVKELIPVSDITNEADSKCNYIEGTLVNLTRQLMDQFPIENESLSKLKKTIDGSKYDLRRDGTE